MDQLAIDSVRAEDLERTDVLALYRSVGWTAYTDHPDVLQQALAGSNHIVVGHLDAELVGLARLITDTASIAYVQDILVAPAYQRRGIGSALLDAVLAPYSSVRQQVLMTDDEPVVRAFYRSAGWLEVDDASGLRAFARFDR